MTEDLLAQLSTLDPASEDRIAEHSAGLTPERIIAASPAKIPTRTVRRPWTIALVAAVVTIGVAVPLYVLRDLRVGGGAADGPGLLADGWYRVATLEELRAEVVTYVPEYERFIIAEADQDPYAFSALSPHDPTQTGELLLYCQTSGWFFSPAHGEQFDLRGNYELGPAATGMVGALLRVQDGWVDIDPTNLSLALPRGTPADPTPSGASCSEGYRVISPGIAVADPSGLISSTPPLPAQPIEVTTPLSGDVISSPVTVSGTANVFEATVSIQILDATGTTLADTFTTASCGSGCRGDYSAEVSFEVTTEQPGTLRVFEVSAMDGSAINTVEVPITLTLGPTASASLTISASNLSFSSSSISVSSGEPISIVFSNQDPGVPHNIAIYPRVDTSKAIFTGKTMIGIGRIRYSVPSLAAGNYIFQCDVHPTLMTGTLIVN